MSKYREEKTMIRVVNIIKNTLRDNGLMFRYVNTYGSYQIVVEDGTVRNIYIIKQGEVYRIIYTQGIPLCLGYRETIINATSMDLVDIATMTDKFMQQGIEGVNNFVSNMSEVC